MACIPTESCDFIEVTKLDAARRQLRLAINLLFSAADPIAVHTLVGAASTIVSDLVEKKCPAESWDRVAYEANKITRREYFQIMREPQNFLKHADVDSDGVYKFYPVNSEEIAFWTVMNLGSLTSLNIEESVLQLWFLACRAPNLHENVAAYNAARETFGDLRQTPRAERLAIARKYLESVAAD